MKISDSKQYEKYLITLKKEIDEFILHVEHLNLNNKIVNTFLESRILLCRLISFSKQQLRIKLQHLTKDCEGKTKIEIEFLQAEFDYFASNLIKEIEKYGILFKNTIIYTINYKGKFIPNLKINKQLKILKNCTSYFRHFLSTKAIVSQRNIYIADHYFGVSQRSVLDLYFKNNGMREMMDYIFSKYNINTNTEKEAILKRLNNEGCGYAAISNSLLTRYPGGAADFLQDFNFPLYRVEYGKCFYNLELLLLDLYLSTDNYARNLFSKRFVLKKEDKSSFIGKGTTSLNRVQRLEKYLLDKHIRLKLISTVRQKFLDYYARNRVVKHFYFTSDILLSVYSKLTFYPLGDYPKINLNFFDGHVVVVMGLDDNGDFIVSSWGRKYLLKRKEILFKTMQILSYSIDYSI